MPALGQLAKPAANRLQAPAPQVAYHVRMPLLAFPLRRAPCPHAPSRLRARRTLALPAALLLALLGGCGSVGVGVGIPVGPFTLGVGTGSGGPSLGLGTGVGPFGAGVGINTSGQVTGNVGVGASVPLGGSAARAGVGVGTGAVLYDPRDNNADHRSGNGLGHPGQATVPQPGVVVPRTNEADRSSRY